jgi:hypothetical protein
MNDKTKRQFGSFPIKDHPSRDGLALDLAINDKIDLYDYSENDNHGTNFGGVGADGEHGPVLRLNGTSDYIDTGKSPITSLPCTIIATFTRDALGNDDQVINTNDVGDTYYGCYMRITDTDIIRANIGDGGGNGANNRLSFDGTATITAGVEHQVAVVFNSLSDVEMYLDGKLTPSAFSSGSAPSANFSAGTFVVGRNMAFSPDRFFAGDISRVSAYNRGISAQEMESYYDNPWQAWERDNLPLIVAATSVGGAPPVTGSVNLLDGLFKRKRLIA